MRDHRRRIYNARSSTPDHQMIGLKLKHEALRAL
jgi:hypothetical protein